jgi:S-adenosylmethionine:tRNA ribosyltransferase-isomerase
MGSQPPTALDSLLAYHLPPDQIATEPVRPRDSARLLLVQRESQSLSDHLIRDLPNLLSPKDLLVFNNSKVIPARLICSQNRTELLLLEETSPGWWTALGTPAKRLKPGTDLFPDPVQGPFSSAPSLRVEKTIPGGQLVIRSLVENFDLDSFGRPPLPPYILKSRKARGQADFLPDDVTTYQTTYAKVAGSVAAPTAGLHFTPELLAQLNHAFVTLHVGLGTFRPIKTTDFRDHPMHEEKYEIGQGLSEKIAAVQSGPAQVGALQLGLTQVRIAQIGMHQIGILQAAARAAALLEQPHQWRGIGASGRGTQSHDWSRHQDPGANQCRTRPLAQGAQQGQQPAGHGSHGCGPATCRL